MENKISTGLNTPQKENKKYVDMTQEELNESIKEQEQFINNLKISEYDLKEVEQLNKDILKQKESIKEKKEQYKQSIKFNQDRIKESKKELKRKESYIKDSIKFKENQEGLLKVIKDIKERLLINPNCYKEVLKE